jgi:acetyltransferase-like isoleucine patch superfamily enzyme
VNNSKVTKYQKNIRERSFLRFVVGLYPRFKNYVVNRVIVGIARRNGASIGVGVTMPYVLARNANANLVVGDHTSIQTWQLDLRSKIEIGSNVIIGSEVQILTVSHHIDSPDWEQKYYGLLIEDYCWLATRAFILPSCRKIGYGSVCAAGSVVASDVESMAVMVGNPAREMRKRKIVHSDLCVEAQLGNDFLPYIAAYRSRSV